MVNGIPIFRVELAEGLIDADNNAERIFGYCIEANKGPVNEPIYVASNAEAKRIFGVNFAPHFYQKGSGLILCRVGFPDAFRKTAKCGFCFNPVVFLIGFYVFEVKHTYIIHL